MDDYKIETQRWVHSVPSALGIIAASIGSLSLLGWVLDSQFLKSISPAFVTIKANTALGLLLLGASIWLLSTRRWGHQVQRLANIMSLTVLAIGLLTLLEYIFSVDLRIDQLLFTDIPQSFDTFSPGRMAAITAFCFVLLGLAIHLLAAKYKSARHLPDLLLCVTALAALFEIVGYLFDAQSLLALGMYGGMAIHTAVAVLAISLGAMFIRPTERYIRPLISTTPAGVMLRWVLPTTVVTPVVVVWLRLYGEQAGWYSAAVGAALSVVTMTSLFAGLSLFGAHAIQRAHRRIVEVEKAARANDRRLRCLLNNTPVMVFMKELDGRYTFANRRFEQLLAAPPGSLEGKTVLDFLPPDHMELRRSRALDEQVLTSKEPVEYEETVQIGAGSRTFLSSRFPTFDDSGNLIAIGGVATDITELKRAEEHINNLFGLATNLVCIADLNGHFVRINPAWEKTLGYSIADLTGKPFMEFIHPDDIAPTAAEYERQAAGGDVISFENRYRCKDGSYRTLLWNATAANAEGLIFATAHDITSRKAAEEQIEALNNDLAARATALAAANAELEAFSYSVSHDLRAPLRSIDGFSQALMEDYQGKLDSRADDYLGRVSAAAQRMGQLIDDLLQLSRLSRAPLRSENLDLSAMAQSINQVLREQNPDRIVEVTIENDLSAMADAGLLHIVLSNLLNNAWKYTAKTEHATIHFGSRRDLEAPVFYIKDNGVGFDMAYVGKLFGAFQRLHSTSEFAGTGIGLATVSRIIRRHGGRVWAEGEAGKGATFYFTLGPQQGEMRNHERQMHSVG